MKKIFHLLSVSALAVLLAARVNAGEYSPVPTNTVSDMYGVGWYGAIHMGANIWQDERDGRVFSNLIGDTLTVEPFDDTGFYGGIKLGYVFGTGGCRFALEEDMFYNGWTSGADFTFTQPGVITLSSASVDVNTGVFMTNGILRFGSGQFQPYIGAGIGAYYGETNNATIGGFSTGGSESHADFAWNVLAGADYYFNPKMSIFFEYKYLQYSSQNDWGSENDLGQQLVGGGMRFHF